MSSLSCRCNNGFTGNGSVCTGKTRGVILEQEPCSIMKLVHADIDECQLGMHTCDEHAGCMNTIGWFECSCNVRYTGSGINCSELQ